MMLLEQEQLYENLKKCSFFTLKVVFLGYIVSPQGIQVDQRKIDAIKMWPVLTSMYDVRSFCGLTSFCRRFICDFSTLATPVTEVLKGTKSVWTPQPKKSIKELKDKLIHAPVLALPCFDKVFEVECDASAVGIGATSNQDGRPLAYFSEKLSDARQRYSTYNKEFLTSVRALKHWTHYLIANEFILHLDHKALKYVQGQHRLNSGHAKWVEYLQTIFSLYFWSLIATTFTFLSSGTSLYSKTRLTIISQSRNSLGCSLPLIFPIST